MQIKLSDHFTYGRLWRFTLPSIVMMIFTSIYGVVDGLFVSNCVGKIAFAAVNFIMPFVLIIGGMGFMIGAGGTALVSKVMGEGRRGLANQYFSMMVYATLWMAFILAAAGVFFIRPVALLMGASREMLGECVLYGRICIGFTWAFMLQNLFQSFLVAAERPKLGLLVTVLAGVTNMVLDAVFIAWFHWGVAGAAIATGLSQCVGGLLPFWYFMRPNHSPLHLVWTKIQWRPLLSACYNGSSELMNNISSSIVGMMYNYQLMKYAGENGVSSYGVLMYVGFVFVAIFIGYTIGVAPIVGYHYGAENHAELKNMLRKSIRINLWTGVGMCVVALVMARTLAEIFVGYDKVLCNMTTHAFYLFAFSFLLCGVNIFASSFFTSLNNGLVSAVISFLHTLVFQCAAVLVLPMLIGLDGIWWSMAVAEFFCAIVSWLFLYGLRGRYHYL